MKKIFNLVFLIFLVSCSEVGKVTPRENAPEKRDNPVIGFGNIDPQDKSDSINSTSGRFGEYSTTEFFFLKEELIYSFEIIKGGNFFQRKGYKLFDFTQPLPYGSKLCSTMGGLYSSGFDYYNNNFGVRDKITAPVIGDGQGSLNDPLSTTNLVAGEMEAMAGLGGFIYYINAGTLWKTDLRTTSGNSRSLCSNYPTGWNGTEAMTSAYLSWPYNLNLLFAVQGGTLWCVNLNNGSVFPFSKYPTGWQGTQTMAAANGYLFVIQGGEFWRVSIATGDVVSLGGGWTGPTTMTSLGGYLYTIQGGYLWRTDTNGNTILYNDSFNDYWVGATQLTAGIN